jgi:hypothetical protein
MINLQKARAVHGISTDLQKCDECAEVCESCIQGKMTRGSHSFSGETASAPLERVHLDTVGELPHPAVTGEKYFETLVDGFTKYVEAKAVHAKSDVPRAVKETLSQWDTQSGCKIKKGRNS